MRNWKVISLLIVILLAGCKKPYLPPAIGTPNSYLVVEGVINNSADSTIIRLSRTVKLSSRATNPVLNATVTVESEQGNTYPLTEATNGNYVSAGLNLDHSQKYRLRIITADNQEYRSDYVPVLNSPPIDSVSYTINTGLQLNVSTHDPKNSTRYYRWSFDETWIFHSNYESKYKSNGDTVLPRKPGEEVYYCWGNNVSSIILLASSAKLSQDVISSSPVTFIPSTSERFTQRYSILVRQYALTSDAYTFWQNLKKNTEQLGGIFDPQPSEINGNIHAITNPSEPVIGYISIGAVTSKRIYINKQQLPTSWLVTQTYPDCQLQPVLFEHKYYDDHGHYQYTVYEEDQFFNYNNTGRFIGPLLIPVSEIGGGHLGVPPECVDCTLRGTTKQPIFWKEN